MSGVLLIYKGKLNNNNTYMREIMVYNAAFLQHSCMHTACDKIHIMVNINSNLLAKVCAQNPVEGNYKCG